MVQEKDKLTFKNTRKLSDITKSIPGESGEQFETDALLDKSVALKDVKLQTQADLYHGTLYTVAPKNYDMSIDLTPDIQEFNHKFVYLWDDYSSLVKFSPDVWVKLKVVLPSKDLMGTRIFKTVSDVYTINSIPKTWLSEQELNPRYVE